MNKKEKKVEDYEITVTKRDLSVWLLCFFRYSLGRHTYIVSDCCEDIMRYWEVIPESYRKQIINDLNHYFEFFLEGEHNCDIKSWRELLEFAKKNLEQ